MLCEEVSDDGGEEIGQSPDVNGCCFDIIKLGDTNFEVKVPLQIREPNLLEASIVEG